MKFPLGAMSVGDILDRGLKLLTARLYTFYAICLIGLAPTLLLQLGLPLLEYMGSGEPSLTFLIVASGGGLATIILAVILSQFVNAAVLHVVDQEFADHPVGIRSAFSFAFRRFWRLLGAIIMADLLIALGTLCFAIPGIIFTIWYFFVAQVVVVENQGGVSALARSKELTDGYRWRIFGIFLIFLVIYFAFFLAAGVLEGVLPSHEMVQTEMGPFSLMLPVGPVIYANYCINTVISFLFQILVQSYSAVCWTLFYFDLRIRKEGFDLEVAAKQQSAIVP